MSGETLTTTEIANIILETTNTLCSNMLQSIDQNIYPLLDKIIFIDKTITTDSYFEKIFGSSSTSGVLILANCLFFAFALYYCTRLLISHFSGNEIESPLKFITRSIITIVAMNSSLEICNLLINGTNQISTFFCTLGEDIFRKEISFSSLTQILSSSSNDSFNFFSLDGILTSTLSISAFGLLISFSLRYIIIKLLILASPFAFLCFCNASTEGFLKSWYRTLLSMLLIQIVISALLIIPYAILKEDSSSLFNKILLVGVISALLKSGQLIKEFMGGIGISTTFQSGISGLKSMFSR